MTTRLVLLAAAFCAVALAGCTGGGGGGGSSDDGSTTTGGGIGVGGNATVGNTTVSGGVSGNGTMGNGTTGNGTSGGDAPLQEAVTIEGGQFVNATVTVRVGGTVTWTHNDGQQAHTVTADDGSFDSSPNCAPTVPPLPPTGDCLTNGETFSTTFSTAGTFSYRCKLTGITGTVMVVA